MSYLYPDCRTALYGDFGKDGKMVESRLGEVTGTKSSSIEECTSCKELAVIDPSYYIFNYPEVTMNSTTMYNFIYICIQNNSEVNLGVGRIIKYNKIRKTNDL